jgi:hypothetical protein
LSRPRLDDQFKPLPETGFFVRLQRFPENFWSRVAQVHANGALGVAMLTLAHDEPDRALPLLAARAAAG